MEVTALLNEEFLKFKKVHGKRYFAPLAYGENHLSRCVA